MSRGAFLLEWIERDADEATVWVARGGATKWENQMFRMRKSVESNWVGRLAHRFGRLGRHRRGERIAPHSRIPGYTAVMEEFEKLLKAD